MPELTEPTPPTVEEVVELLRPIVSEEGCTWDHNHSCQTHYYFYIPQGEMCPQYAAQEFIREWDKAHA